VLNEERQPENIPEFTPGDKIYKLFNHHKVRVRGKKEEFVIKVIKVKNNKCCMTWGHGPGNLFFSVQFFMLIYLLLIYDKCLM